MLAVVIGEVFLDDYFGPHWTRHFFIRLIAAVALAYGVLFLAFRGPMFANEAKVTRASLARMFGLCVLISCIFGADVVFESVIYPAFALHGWTPERFVWHAAEMVFLAVVIVWVGHRTRMKFLREIREAEVRESK